MKGTITIVLIASFIVFMMIPSSGYSWHRYPVHHHGHVYFYGWVPAAIIAGTFLTSAIILSSTYERPRPSYRPPAAYMDPGPPAYYPLPGQAYAAPDPEFTAKYSKNQAGEWVTIPGQWVENTWVPQHKVFVPANP